MICSEIRSLTYLPSRRDLNLDVFIKSDGTPSGDYLGFILYWLPCLRTLSSVGNKLGSYAQLAKSREAIGIYETGLITSAYYVRYRIYIVL
jgi:hypothetical protein